MTNRAKQTLLFVGIFLGLTATGRAERIDAAQDQTHISAAAIAPGIFRISVSTKGDDSPIKSAFIDPAFAPGDLGKVTPRGLVTEQGVLSIDPAKGTMSLSDAKGNVLLPSVPLVSTRDGDAPATQLHLGWPADRPFDVYGTGNGTNELVQHSVKPRVGNGVAVEPFFYSPAGFAEFVVGSDENKPASCDGKVTDGAITWTVPGTKVDLYLIIAPTLLDATHGLLTLTGKPPVPPRWTFGYMQSRWGWKDQAYVADTLKEFQNRKLPVDAFIFDFEWYTRTPDYSVKPEGLPQFPDFQFNPVLFPDPKKQIDELHSAGVHFVGIRKPRMGDSDTLQMLHSKGMSFIGGKGTDARGVLFSNPATRDWYSAQTQPLLQAGVDGWWNDEGEFSYGNYLFWNMAERQALDVTHPEARLWTLNRAFQPGLSRLGAAAWSGDIRARWEDLLKTPTTLLNWGLAGMPYSACDIGGFSADDTPELLTRWMEAGAFFPVMRTHSTWHTTPHFPWLYGPDAESAMHEALALRYQLIPMLYSLAHETQQTGEPIMRPLLLDYPTDGKVANLSSEWLIGHGLLAAPVLTQANHRTVYLPADDWYNFFTGEKVAGGREFDLEVPLDQVPVYVRAGTILPLAPPILHTRDLPGGPLDLRIYPGHDATFTLVEDDGSTNAYMKGDLRKTTFSWTDATHSLSWKSTGSYDGSDRFRSMSITVVAPGAQKPVLHDLTTEGGVQVQ